MLRPIREAAIRQLMDLGSEPLAADAAKRALDEFARASGERGPSDPERVRQFNEANAKAAAEQLAKFTTKP